MAAGVGAITVCAASQGFWGHSREYPPSCGLGLTPCCDAGVITSVSFVVVGRRVVSANRGERKARRRTVCRNSTGVASWTGTSRHRSRSYSTCSTRPMSRTGRSAPCARRPTRQRSSLRRADPPMRPSESALAARCVRNAWSTPWRTMSASASGAACPNASGGSSRSAPCESSPNRPVVRNAQWTGKAASGTGVGTW